MFDVRCWMFHPLPPHAPSGGSPGAPLPIDLVKNIGEPMLTLPRTAPVMVLPDALLFPNSLLPLFIFEPRYREMLKWVLAEQRVFCIAQMKPGVSEAQTPDDFHQTGGLGLVRACVAFLFW